MFSSFPDEDYLGDVAIPFGKHKGRRLSEIPEDYLVWCWGIARTWLSTSIAYELRKRERFERLQLPCRHCDGIAESWCVKCGALACFRHVREVGPTTAYCFDHWDHWLAAAERRVRMPSEEAVRWADEHPTEAGEHFARQKKRAERRAARLAASPAL